MWKVNRGLHNCSNAVVFFFYKSVYVHNTVYDWGSFLWYPGEKLNSWPLSSFHCTPNLEAPVVIVPTPHPTQAHQKCCDIEFVKKEGATASWGGSNAAAARISQHEQKIFVPVF